MVTLTVSKAEALHVIQEQVDECRLLTQDDHYSTWKMTTCIILERFFSDQTIAQAFAMKSFSTIKNDAHLLGLSYLESLIRDIHRGLFDPIGPQNQIDNEHFHLIVRRILNNFYKRLFKMYPLRV